MVKGGWWLRLDVYLIIIFPIFFIFFSLDHCQSWSIVQLLSQVVQECSDGIDGQNVHRVNDEIVSKPDKTVGRMRHFDERARKKQQQQIYLHTT